MTDQEKKKTSTLKKVIKIFLLLIVLIGIVITVLYNTYLDSYLKGTLEVELSTLLSEKVEINSVRFSLFNGIECSEMVVASDNNQPINIGEIKLDLDLMPILDDEIKIKYLTLNKIKVNHTLDSNGKSNFDKIIEAILKPGEPSKYKIEIAELNAQFDEISYENGTYKVFNLKSKSQNVDLTNNEKILDFNFDKAIIKDHVITNYNSQLLVNNEYAKIKNAVMAFENKTINFDSNLKYSSLDDFNLKFKYEDVTGEVTYVNNKLESRFYGKMKGLINEIANRFYPDLIQYENYYEDLIDSTIILEYPDIVNRLIESNFNTSGNIKLTFENVKNQTEIDFLFKDNLINIQKSKIEKFGHILDAKGSLDINKINYDFTVNELITNTTASINNNKGYISVSAKVDELKDSLLNYIPDEYRGYIKDFKINKPGQLDLTAEIHDLDNISRNSLTAKIQLPDFEYIGQKFSNFYSSIVTKDKKVNVESVRFESDMGSKNIVQGRGLIDLNNIENINCNFNLNFREFSYQLEGLYNVANNYFDINKSNLTFVKNNFDIKGRLNFEEKKDFAIFDIKGNGEYRDLKRYVDMFVDLKSYDLLPEGNYDLNTKVIVKSIPENYDTISELLNQIRLDGSLLLNNLKTYYGDISEINCGFTSDNELTKFKTGCKFLKGYLDINGDIKLGDSKLKTNYSITSKPLHFDKDYLMHLGIPEYDFIKGLYGNISLVLKGEMNLAEIYDNRNSLTCNGVFNIHNITSNAGAIKNSPVKISLSNNKLQTEISKGKLFSGDFSSKFDLDISKINLNDFAKSHLEYSGNMDIKNTSVLSYIHNIYPELREIMFFNDSVNVKSIKGDFFSEKDFISELFLETNLERLVVSNINVTKLKLEITKIPKGYRVNIINGEFHEGTLTGKMDCLLDTDKDKTFKGSINLKDSDLIEFLKKWAPGLPNIKGIFNKFNIANIEGVIDPDYNKFTDKFVLSGNFEAVKIMYNETPINKFAGQIDIKNKKARLLKLGGGVAGGSIVSVINVSPFEDKVIYGGNIYPSGIQTSKFLEMFTPIAKSISGGKIKVDKFEFKGAGITYEDVVKNLYLELVFSTEPADIDLMMFPILIRSIEKLRFTLASIKIVGVLTGLNTNKIVSENLLKYIPDKKYEIEKIEKTNIVVKNGNLNVSGLNIIGRDHLDCLVSGNVGLNGTLDLKLLFKVKKLDNNITPLEKYILENLPKSALKIGGTLNEPIYDTKEFKKSIMDGIMKYITSSFLQNNYDNKVKPK